jgi:hypothetical protein
VRDREEESENENENENESETGKEEERGAMESGHSTSLLLLPNTHAYLHLPKDQIQNQRSVAQ